jgi:hypothetical protein
MYKICSFDVGIKNLAYCIICKDGNNISIEKWDIINLIDDQIFNCSSIIGKTNNVCGKKASLVGTDITGAVKYFCGAHKTKYTPYDKLPEYDQCAKTKCSCTVRKAANDTPCGKPAYSTKDNLYYCNQHKKTATDKLIKSTALKKLKHKSCTTSNVGDLCFNMYKKLDSIQELTTVNEIFIENQPSLKNPTMKTISCLLFGYFISLQNRHNLQLQVKFISPSNKLKADPTKIDQVVAKVDDNDKVHTILTTLIAKHGPSDDLTIETTIKYLLNKKTMLTQIKDKEHIKILGKIEKDDKNYDLNKLLSIKYTEVLLEGSQDWLTHLSKYKKKDDLCDSFLQGYYLL